MIVEGKRGLDTFATTNLDFILRARGITTVALGGFLSDWVAATSTEEHENAIRFDYPMFSDVMTSQAFTDALHGAAVPSG